jgi:TRAP-type C4-dicarboxylate transport system permease small subunit
MITSTGALAHRDERGEGVVSSAIAVLIFAALGALMWVGFKNIWGNASSQTSTQIDSIGR